MIKSELNFLPIKQRKKVKKPVSFRKICLGLFLIACIVFFFSYGILFRLNEICLSEINALEKLIQIKKEQEIPFEHLAQKGESLDFKAKILKKLEGSKKNALVLMALQESIPENTELIEYRLEEDQVFFKGKTESASEIFEMEEALIKTQYFKAVNSVNSEKKSKDSVVTLNDQRPKEMYWEFAFSMKLIKE